MVDVNTGTSALQAQLQASKAKSAVSARSAPSGANKSSDFPGKRIAARTDIPSADRRLPVKINSSASKLSTTQEIDDASFRVAEFTGSSREAPLGRISNESSLTRNQPLGQIINILV